MRDKMRYRGIHNNVNEDSVEFRTHNHVPSVHLGGNSDDVSVDDEEPVEPHCCPTTRVESDDIVSEQTIEQRWWIWFSPMAYVGNQTV